MHLLIQSRPLAATIRGGAVLETVANGTSVQVTTIAALVEGGYAPYTYDWTDDVAEISPQVSATVSAVLQTSGTDVNYTGTLVLVATDARGVIVTTSAAINVTQGSPP